MVEVKEPATIEEYLHSVFMDIQKKIQTPQIIPESTLKLKYNAEFMFNLIQSVKETKEGKVK